VECDKVIIDDELGAYQATNKFISQGKKRIALITTDDYLSVSKARTKGYWKALQDSELEADESMILKMPSMEMDEQAIKNFLNTKNPDAVLCVNEIFAVYSMRLVQQKGLRIPEDIAFIGFTDGVLSKYANPSLTVVAQHGEKMGEVSAQMLIDKVESEAEEETYQTKILEPTLVIRDSIAH
jgi:LacI family transcriptional regulator